MPQPPSRRDLLGPPKRDVSKLASLVRHHGYSVRQIEPGLQDGRFGTLRPVVPGHPQLVGGDTGGDEAGNDILFANTDTTTAGAGEVVMHLSFLPEDGSEHVFWHPGGGGGIPLFTSDWTRDDQVLRIPAFAGQAVGDVYSCRYAYYEGEEEPAAPSVVGFTVPGVWDLPSTTLTYAIPPGTAAGDLLVLSVRGAVAAGGGELINAVSCSDARMASAFVATAMNSGHLIVESIWVGTHDGSTNPVVVTVTQNPSFNATAAGVLASLTGANGWGVVAETEVSASTPTVAGVAAVAVTWLRATSFGTVNAAAPSSYTDIASTGFGPSSTDVSFWYDPEGVTSPTGTHTALDEGCCVIAII